MSMIERGQIYDYDFGQIEDQRQAGLRPALIIQTDSINEIEGYGLTIVLPITTKGRPSYTYVRIDPTPENGLSEVSFVKCEQPYTVPKRQLTNLKGSASKQELYRVAAALRIVLAIP